MLVIFCLHGRTFFSYHNSSRCEFDSEGKHWIVMRGGGVGITMTHDIQVDDREKEERGDASWGESKSQEGRGVGYASQYFSQKISLKGGLSIK